MQKTNFYEKDNYTPLDAKFEAQKIAFAPFVFQATLALRDLGILTAIEKHGKNGVRIEDLEEGLDLSAYGIKVLIEAGLGIGLFLFKDDKYSLSNLGYFILNDSMTRVNMDFTQDVNYQGLFYLKEAIKTGEPAGLKRWGDWPTIYQALADLPEGTRQSWLRFDHFYSDNAFSAALREVFKDKPKKLMDIGGNTGKWAIRCLEYDPEIEISIADLPGQLRMAERTIAKEGFNNRVEYHAVDLLLPEQRLPERHDAIWMSQFLDCFSQAEIIVILKKAAEVMTDDDRLYILETYWNRQKFEAASFCLQQTSLYFTSMANGNSQMYHSKDMLNCLEAAGMEVVEDVDNVGICHTLFKCRKKW